MNLREEVEKIKTQGYSEANAESKLCQDIVLKALAESGMARNAKFVIKASEEDFARIVELIKKSGVDKSVTFERAE